MRKLIFIIISVLLSILTNAQTVSFYKTPQEFPTEFDKVSSEYGIWSNNNLDVVSYDYSLIDTYTLSVIKSNPTIDNIDLLVSLLGKGSKNDLEKTRSYYIWIINSMVYDVSIRDTYTTSMKSSENREDEAIYCFKNRKGACVEISTIFYTMCKKGGIRAYTIGGYVKNLSGDKYVETGHAWNIFKYGNRYFFLDATFGLQTKYKNDVFKNAHFVINSELYKYLYKPYDIYGKLNYKYNDITRSYEKDWTLYNLAYADKNVVNDNDYIEFNKVLLLVDKVFKINSNIWINFPVFGYEYFTTKNIKQVSTNRKIETKCPIDTFVLLKSKEYKNMNSTDRIAYNKSAEVYYPYWINYYKMKAENSKSEPVLYEENVKKMKKLEYDFTYYKLFKK